VGSSEQRGMGPERSCTASPPAPMMHHSHPSHPPQAAAAIHHQDSALARGRKQLRDAHVGLVALDGHRRPVEGGSPAKVPAGLVGEWGASERAAASGGVRSSVVGASEHPHPSSPGCSTASLASAITSTGLSRCLSHISAVAGDAAIWRAEAVGGLSRLAGGDAADNPVRARDNRGREEAQRRLLHIRHLLPISQHLAGPGLFSLLPANHRDRPGVWKRAPNPQEPARCRSPWR
jgi:hypothetical protein